MIKKIKLILSKLRKKKLSIAVAESCTGGMLAQSITSLNGASKVFSFGVVTYSNESKIKLLGVPNKIISKYGSVSEECCRSMIVNLEKISKSKISLAITGIAGPRGGSQKKPVGLVYVGIKKKKKIKINKYLFKNKSRENIRRNSVKKSLELIQEFI